MFSVHCATHESEVLLSERHITGLRNTDAGIEVHWTCWCRQKGSFVTGRPRRRDSK